MTQKVAIGPADLFVLNTVCMAWGPKHSAYSSQIRGNTTLDVKKIVTLSFLEVHLYCSSIKKRKAQVRVAGCIIRETFHLKREGFVSH